MVLCSEQAPILGEGPFLCARNGLALNIDSCTKNQVLCQTHVQQPSDACIVVTPRRLFVLDMLDFTVKRRRLFVEYFWHDRVTSR